MSRQTLPGAIISRAHRPVRRVLGAAALLAAAALLPRTAQAQAADTAVYVVNGNTLSVIMNRATGYVSDIATLAFATSAVARDPVTKRIYYLANGFNPSRVAYYDPATGNNTILNNSGAGGDLIVKVTFVGGMMYGIGDLSHGSVLYQIDPADGSITALGAVHVGSAGGEDFPDNGDLAYDPLTGTLYANANRPNGANGTSLYTIDIGTRIATHVGVVATNLTQAALTFARGVLYSGGTNGEFYAVNTSTGAGTWIADHNETYADFTTGPPMTDLQVSMTVSNSFSVGSNEYYRMVVRNNGPYPVTDVLVVDTLPAGIQYVSYSGGTWSCGAAGQIVTCTHSGTLSSGGTATTLQINVTPLQTVAPSVTNTASVSSELDDSDWSNNSASRTSKVTVRSVAVTPDSAAAAELPSNGTTYAQIFDITNSGSQNDRYDWDVTVAPAGVVTIVSVDGNGATSGTTGNLPSLRAANLVVVYSVATAAVAGATATITLTAVSRNTGSISDTGTLVVTVERAALAMAKQLYRDDRSTLVAGAVASGEYVQYKVVVTSSGGAAATTVHVSDPIPTAVTYDSASGDAAGWTFANAAGTLSADLSGTLATGQSRFFWLRVRVK